MTGIFSFPPNQMVDFSYNQKRINQYIDDWVYCENIFCNSVDSFWQILFLEQTFYDREKCLLAATGQTWCLRVSFSKNNGREGRQRGWKGKNSKITVNYKYYEMSGTQKPKKEQYLRQLRVKIVSFIAYLRSKVKSMGRGCFCLAVTIFDRCLSSPFFSIPKEYDPRQRDWMLAVACISISFKFLTRHKYDYNVLLNHLRVQDRNDELYAKITRLENEILCQIQWKIPYLTAFELLEEVITDDDMVNDSRKNVVLSLKVLLKAYILGPEISLNPTFGPQFYLIASKKDGASEEAKLLYERCLVSLESLKGKKKAVDEKET